jgi:formylglycine-generating enzyme required for sulfatase activity
VLKPCSRTVVLRRFENEKDRDDSEGPRHRVTIAKAFALGKLELTVAQLAAFADETRYDAGNACDVWQGGKLDERPGNSWRKPNFPQSGKHPASPTLRNTSPRRGEVGARRAPGAGE